MPPSFAYARPRTTREVPQRLQTTGSRIRAGGTDLLGCLRDGVFKASEIVSWGAPELRGIEAATQGGLRIGAMTTLDEIASHAGQPAKSSIPRTPRRNWSPWCTGRSWSTFGVCAI